MENQLLSEDPINVDETKSIITICNRFHRINEQLRRYNDILGHGDPESSIITKIIENLLISIDSVMAMYSTYKGMFPNFVLSYVIETLKSIQNVDIATIRQYTVESNSSDKLIYLPIVRRLERSNITCMIDGINTIDNFVDHYSTYSIFEFEG